VKEFISSNVKRQAILMNIINGNKLEASLIDSSNTTINTKYELIADIYSEFVRELNTYPFDDSVVHSFLIEKKEEILKNTLLMNTIMANKIYLINPEIKFVYDSILLRTCILDANRSSKIDIPFMTLSTWISVYEPLYKKATDNLIADGLIHENKTFREFIVETPEESLNVIKVGTNPSTMYEKNVCDMIVQEMKKVFCRMTVSGTLFPIEMEFNE
jgi:hypothetical protein